MAAPQATIQSCKRPTCTAPSAGGRTGLCRACRTELADAMCNGTD